MAINYPGPYEWRLTYQTVASTIPTISQLRLSINVTSTPGAGEAYADIEVTERGGGTSTLAAWQTGFMALLDDVFHTSTDFVGSEIWLYSPGTFDATFITGEPLGTSGVSSTAPTQDGQAIVSFRTTTGGIAKLVLMQPSLAVGVTQTFPTSLGAINALASNMSNLNSPLIGRDNGFVFVPYKYNPGLSETLFKRRLRF